MPCWFYDKKDLRVTPSSTSGLDSATEARYRREGARFIIDAGTKMKLRYDTCSTGVTYFHRFYMFHSFTEFNRYIIGASCLFLAGKVEETPKKCKDVVKICRTILTDQQFAAFKDNPREEIMTYERILLQTLKFDLQVEHPYAHLVRMAKLIYGDNQTLQKVVQMAWTFINDSLCTTLCLQWEAEIIAVSMLYLGTKLSNFEITDWAGRQPGSKAKWWETLVEGLCQELIEAICHQVLDLYSPSQKKSGESPPLSTPATQTTPTESNEGRTPKKEVKANSHGMRITTPDPKSANQSYQKASAAAPATSTYQALNTVPYSQTNPYVSSQMYSSSFMTGDGSQSIQSLIYKDPGASLTTATSYPQSYPDSAQYPPAQYSYQYKAPTVRPTYPPASFGHTIPQSRQPNPIYQPSIPSQQHAATSSLPIRITGRQPRR